MGTLANPAAARHANEMAMLQMTRAAGARGMKNIIATKQLETVMDQTKTQADVQRWTQFVTNRQIMGKAKAHIVESGRATTGFGARQLLGRVDYAAEQDFTRIAQNEDNVLKKYKWDHWAGEISNDFEMQAAFDNAHAQMRSESMAMLTGMFNDATGIAGVVGGFV